MTSRARLSRFLGQWFMMTGLLAVSLRGAGEGNDSPLAFRAQDRWCAIGDSITHSGSYHEWIQLYWMTRFPTHSLELFNGGISGDTAEGGLRRFLWDILPNRPTVASVMFGMNDVARTLYSDAPASAEVMEKRRDRLAHYEQNQRALVATLQRNGARVVLITPSIFDQTAEIEAPTQTGVNDALAACAEIVRKIASDSGAGLVDFYNPMERLNRERQKSDPHSTIIGPDRIHPGPPGHFAMAYFFLKAQQAPALVSKVTVDVAPVDPRTVDALNGQVKRLRREKGGVAFTWLEQALPYPIDPVVAPALEWVPFVSDFNQEIVQVSGLPTGNYLLRIDGQDLQSYSAEAWEKGVNLAELATTPQMKQADEVLRLLNARTMGVAENLRSLAHVEHQSAPANVLPITLEKMQPYLEKRLEKFKTSPPAASTREGVERYADRKPHEAEARAEATRLEEAARRAAVPVSHEIAILPFLSPIDR